MSTVPVRSQQTSVAVQMIIHPIARKVGFIQDNGNKIGLFTGDNGVILIDDQQVKLDDYWPLIRHWRPTAERYLT